MNWKTEKRKLGELKLAGKEAIKLS